MSLIKKGKNYEKAISEAYNMLVTFKLLVEEKNIKNTYSPDEIENVYKNLFCEALPNRKVPWNFSPKNSF